MRSHPPSAATAHRRRSSATENQSNGHGTRVEEISSTSSARRHSTSTRPQLRIEEDFRSPPEDIQRGHRRRPWKFLKLQGHPPREPPSSARCLSPPVPVDSGATHLQNSVAPGHQRLLCRQPIEGGDREADLRRCVPLWVCVHNSLSKILISSDKLYTWQTLMEPPIQRIKE